MKLPWDETPIKKVKYPDRSSYVVVEDFPPHLEFRINTYEDLWTLTQIKDVYDHNNRPLSVTIPCLLDAQADRRFASNQPHSLKLLLRHLNSLQFEDIEVFHPHNAEIVEAMLDNVTILDNSSFILDVLEDIYDVKRIIYFDRGVVTKEHLSMPIDNLVLMSSDAGGFKPLMKLVDKIGWQGETFSASKARKYEDGKSSLIQQIDRQDFQGKDILIIDDICVKGGTFVGLAKMLKERNCGNLYLAVSHMTVLDFNEELTLLYDAVLTTNSKGLRHGEYSSRGVDLTILNYK